METVEPAQEAAVAGRRGPPDPERSRRRPGDPARDPEARAFRSRPFRVFMAGCVVSWVGDWMDLAAMNWAVLELTGSPLNLGLVIACRLVPAFALSLPAGVLADRFDRRRLLIRLQIGAMLLTFAFAALVAARSPFWLFALAVAARSVLVSMATPVRNALLPNLVPTAALGAAVASQAALMNLARIVGPALAGGLLAVLPMEDAFWINGLSYLAVLATLAAIRPADVRGLRPRDRRPHRDVREAVAFVREDAAVQSLLILAVVPMVFGFPYTSLMPLFAQDLLGLGPEGFGLLLSISAAGALAGSAWLSVRGPTGRAGRTGPWLVGSILGFGAALLLFSLARGFLPAAAMMFLVGLASQVYRTTSRVALQHRVPDHLRGRILSIALMDRGLIPLGAVLLGAIAEAAGTWWAVVTMGAGCVVVTLALLAARRQVWDL